MPAAQGSEAAIALRTSDFVLLTSYFELPYRFGSKR
jgi:hypothetical protein